MAREKPFRGHKLVITFAHQAPLDQHGGAQVSSSLKGRKSMVEKGRPITLSMLKTGLSSCHEGFVHFNL